MLAEDLQVVLVFMSKTMKPFLVHIGRYLLMFILTVLVLVPGFFLSLRAAGSVWGFVVLAVIVFAVHWLIRRGIVLPSLIRIDRLFLDFILKNESIAESLDKKDVAEVLPGVRQAFGSNAPFRISRGIRAAALVLSLDTELLSGQPDERWRMAFGRAFKYSLTGYLLFAAFLVVFLGISFLSTLGLDLALKLLIFTLGTLFAAFLFQAVVEPIFYLLVLNRMRQNL